MSNVIGIFIHILYNDAVCPLPLSVAYSRLEHNRVRQVSRLIDFFQAEYSDTECALTGLLLTLMMLIIAKVRVGRHNSTARMIVGRLQGQTARDHKV